MIEYVSYEEPESDFYVAIDTLCWKHDAYWRVEVDEDGNCIYILSLSQEAIHKY